jgi:hypothetical protein
MGPFRHLGKTYCKETERISKKTQKANRFIFPVVQSDSCVTTAFHPFSPPLLTQLSPPLTQLPPPPLTQLPPPPLTQLPPLLLTQLSPTQLPSPQPQLNWK